LPRAPFLNLSTAMKILDRYVTSSFIKNYLLSFMILVGLYVVLDMLFNFDDLVTVQAKAGAAAADNWWPILQRIGDFYFYQIFLFFVQLSGIIPIVAAAFTLMRMSRQNELSATLSAGVPLLRLAWPIILAAILFNALMIVDQELVIPGMIPKLVRSHNEAGESSTHAFGISSMQDSDRNILLAAKYVPDPNHPYMVEITLIQRDEQYMPTAQITAERADWQPDNTGGGEWTLTNARMVTGLEPGGKPRVTGYDQPYRGNITPEEINLYRSNSFVNLLSSERVNQLLNPSRAASYGANQLLRVKHSRITQPIMNVILLLLAIPCVLTREPGKLKSAAFKCLLLSGAGMGAIFLCAMLAGQPPANHPEWADRWPALMAFMPIIIFGPLAVFLLDRVET
jgi:lipopolysaccharide export system permease protein